MDFLVVGLGNPGSEYQNTRHNIAWSVLESAPFSSHLAWREKYKGFYASHGFRNVKGHFLKPQTYMNLSGESVQPCADFFKIRVENILVVHDELDLPFGTLAFKKGGGLAGHNGLKSISQILGSQDFLRLRLGIGRPTHGNVASYVLSNFSSDERMVLDDFLKGGGEAIDCFMNEGFQKAAKTFSKKSYTEV